MVRVSLNSRTKFYVDHWDTQAVHLSVEGSLWSSSNNYSLGNTLSSISDRTALLLFTMMEIANSIEDTLIVLSVLYVWSDTCAISSIESESDNTCFV